MKAYVVGGAVRDQLMGVPSNDRDWVVVGATPEQMVAAGFTPVGRDFPVFLHPQTHEEYALARTERKSGAGYHGFVFHTAPDVTLEQDLARRDLTINAMALDPDTGALVDPFGGAADVRAGVLRHVSDAFAEDPVRLLRVARFAARQVLFQRDVGCGVEHEPAVAGARLALGACERVFLMGQRMQEHREIAPHRREAGRHHLLRCRANDDPVAVVRRHPHQLVAHRTADDIRFHRCRSSCRVRRAAVPLKAGRR